MLNAMWHHLIEKAYSFVIKDNKNVTIGVALNFDANDEPEVPCNGSLSIIFEFLDYIEEPIRYD